MSDAVLRARSVSKSYDGGPRTVEVLRNLDMEVAAGESVAVVGDSGVGKSTLLHILGGLDRPTSGDVLFRGEMLSRKGTAGIATFRNRHIGFVFQMHHLLPEFTALENVEMPFRIGRVDEPYRERSREILEKLGLKERTDHFPAALSGGEQQRVAIARAVATGPAVVLADEPTGNLDPNTGISVFRLLRELQEREGFALVLATHSARLARNCDRILRLEDGAVHPLGETEAVDYFDA